MSETTKNFGFIVPEAPGVNPSEPFDWEEFIRNNWFRADQMKVLGGTRLINAKEYVTGGRFDLAGLMADASGDLASGVAIYFPAGDYGIDSELDFGANEAITALWLFGAKGAVLNAGDQIANVIHVQHIEDVTVQGLSIRGAASDVAATLTTGIRLSDVQNASIENTRITDTAYAIVAERSVNDPTRRVWIKNNYIENYNKIGIDIDRAIDVIVRDNYIYRAPSMMEPADLSLGHGIRVTPGDDATTQVYQIEGNTVFYPRRNGIELQTGVGSFVIEVKGNKIVEPGNFSSPGDQTAKATRGSGIYSVAAGRVSISENTIIEPISHGILLQDATRATIVKNTVEMAINRGSLNGLSWHGIAVTGSAGVVIENNSVTLGTAASAQYQGENREGIIVNGSDKCQIAGNVIEGSVDGVYVAGSDAPMVSFNRINSVFGGSKGVYIYGANGATCHNPVVVGNTVDSATSQQIAIVGGSSYARSPVVIGNRASLSVTPSDAYDVQSSDRIFGNFKTDTYTNLLDTPQFGINEIGAIFKGRTSGVRSFSPGAFSVYGSATIGKDDAGYPAVVFADSGTGEAYIVVDYFGFDNAGNNGIGVEMWLSSEATAGGTAVMNVSYGFLNRTVDGIGNTKPALANLVVPIVLSNTVKYTTTTIPNSDAVSGKPILVIKIWRDPANGNDTISRAVYLHGVRVTWRALRPFTGYEAGVV